MPLLRKNPSVRRQMPRIFLKIPDRLPYQQTAGKTAVIWQADYLSPAPQAEPHAAGFSSGLSPAPQAEPHAAGFSSGLSPAPQAEPHAAGFSSGLSPPPQAEAGAAI